MEAPRRASVRSRKRPAAFSGLTKSHRFPTSAETISRPNQKSTQRTIVAGFSKKSSGGLFGPEDFFENPATIVLWVDFWVGLGIVSALVGNLWDFVSPLNAAGRFLERTLARRGASITPYPTRLGLWPATVFLLVWSWLELVWDPGKEPRTLVLILLSYIAIQLLAMVTFGTELWLARGELFTVVARTFARFAPLELYVREPAGECRALLCTDEERIGCPSCWLDATPEARGLRLRPFGAGVRREAPLGPGGGTFVLALLATVVYDGFSQTQTYVDLQSWFVDRSVWLAVHDSFLDTVLGAAIVAAFVLAFLAVVGLVSRLEHASLADAARRYSPTLIPIAAVYFVSHYFLFLIYAGQFTRAAVLDPFGREWVPDVEVPWKGVPGGLVWYLQVGLIVWGHVVAVFEAHRVSLGVQADLEVPDEPARHALPGHLDVGHPFASERVEHGRPRELARVDQEEEVVRD